mmetsp:Transcript_22092/g.61472  ORF Transcript_22092/g.61472 Transcript_22092/m.61472 type:complete len:154 (+) Transcript_22092:180-641(+)
MWKHHHINTRYVLDIASMDGTSVACTYVPKSRPNDIDHVMDLCDKALAARRCLNSTQFSHRLIDTDTRKSCSYAVLSVAKMSECSMGNALPTIAEACRLEQSNQLQFMYIADAIPLCFRCKYLRQPTDRHRSGFARHRLFVVIGRINVLKHRS